MGNTIWELDFYSRPILDERKKKVWEVLICESPQDNQSSLDELFQYSQFCSNQTVNSLWLKEAIEEAISKASEPPKKIRFFRRQMNNMIVKASDELNILAVPSRRTYTLHKLLEKRQEDFYPQQPGFDPAAVKSLAVQYPPQPAKRLPDAARGDRGDKWAFVSLEASAFQEMGEWEIGFQEGFPLALAGVEPDTRIPGLIIFSPRALPLAGWMSGLDLGYLRFEDGPRAKILLETGIQDSWILAELTAESLKAEARNFAEAKARARGVHFLAIQSQPESESFAGFWLLQEL